MKIKSKIEYRIDSNGDRMKRLESSYNEDGKLIREVEFFKSGAVLFEKAFEYNDDQKLISEKVWNEIGSCTQTNFEYDEEGLLVLKTMVHPDGAEEIERRSTIGAITTVESLDEDGKLVEKNVTTYNEKSKALSSEYYDGEDLIESHINIYNESDHLIGQEITMHQSGGKLMVKYTIGSNDKIESTICTDDQGNLVYRYDYTHENELLKEERVEDYQYQPKQEIKTNSFDDQGNLISKNVTDFEGNVKVQIQIKYNDQNDIISVISAGQQYGDNTEFAYEIEYHEES